MHDLEVFATWYEGLTRYANGFPAKGTMSGALVVLERLKSTYSLSLDAHTAPGGSQISGASGTAVKRILSSFGEERQFVAEGGRTNRGLRGDIRNMLSALESLQLSRLSEAERIACLSGMQQFLVERIREWHGQKRISVSYDPSRTSRDFIHQILLEADARKFVGPVAQYLVGAKLQLRFPDQRIGNESYSTADQQLGRAGDFVLHDTAFHITVSPMDKVYDRCRHNLEAGMQAYLIVPQAIVEAARTNANSVAPGRISVESIESFVGGNVDELSVFGQSQTRRQMGELLALYNQRVSEVEVDKSMLIDIPHNLEI